LQGTRRAGLALRTQNLPTYGGDILHVLDVSARRWRGGSERLVRGADPPTRSRASLLFYFAALTPDRQDARGSVRSPASDCAQAFERSLLAYRFTNTIPFADSVLLGSKVFVPSVAARR
jgi:hypothetical protein